MKVKQKKKCTFPKFLKLQQMLERCDVSILHSKKEPKAAQKLSLGS